MDILGELATVKLPVPILIPELHQVGRPRLVPIEHLAEHVAEGNGRPLDLIEGVRRVGGGVHPHLPELLVAFVKGMTTAANKLEQLIEADCAAPVGVETVEDVEDDATRAAEVELLAESREELHIVDLEARVARVLRVRRSVADTVTDTEDKLCLGEKRRQTLMEWGGVGRVATHLVEEGEDVGHVCAALLEQFVQVFAHLPDGGPP